MGIFDKLKKKKEEDAPAAAAPAAAAPAAAAKSAGKAAPATQQPAIVPPPQPKAAPDTAQAIAQQQKKIKLLEAKEGQLLKRMDDETNKAKEFLAKGDKNSAKTCLNRKKMYEAQLEPLRKQRLNIEKLVMALETNATNVVAVTGLEEGKNALAAAQANLSAEKIDDIMFEMGEEIQKAYDIQTAAAQEVMGGPVIDEMAVDDELAELEELNLQEKIAAASVPATAAGAKSPTKAPAKAPAKTAAVKQEEEVDDELAALEKQMLH
mmetsp:Transcript_11379/g.19475  ORF Transcript_11379/g.19475 Transcript_11379/m.19475 type:complete len:265 (+) Transcript_11379:243-1037(+)|eukprot:CAMPEP_0184696364 /NCGR_PEP_ID=MMETSP0313-20130426/3687_1 /TAXON_ID=2792 /ORGANISM="Porphyridium aerugineum, Strain SAG 1380-2" /LENGTH=264 /DNA_ID=CAMNT_0027154983 /DNA_START=342 /DNA_END=1136 /DNA_ORIENTATION=+